MRYRMRAMVALSAAATAAVFAIATPAVAASACMYRLSDYDGG